MAEKSTPDSLYKFFSRLDPGDVDDNDTEIAYASPSVVRKGLEAAKMLQRVQKALGIAGGEAAGKKQAGVKKSPADEGEGSALSDALNESEAEVDRLLTQNMEIKEEKKALSEKSAQLRETIRHLHKQINRMHDKTELQSILSKVEGGPPPEAKKPEPLPAEDEAAPAAEERVEEEKPPEDVETAETAEEKSESEAAADSQAAAQEPAAGEALSAAERDAEEYLKDLEREMMNAVRVPEEEREQASTSADEKKTSD